MNNRLSRVLLSDPPFQDYEAKQLGSVPAWTEVDRWPARWVEPNEGVSAPFLALFRLGVHLAEPANVRLHVSAHERYELFWEHGGVRRLVGRGPTRAPAGFRHFETYEVEFGTEPGILWARVAQLGPMAPWAQADGRCGFLCAAQDESLWDRFNTGRAPWLVRLLEGMEWRSPRSLSGHDMGCGALEVATGEAITPGRWGTGTWDTPRQGKSGNNGFTLYARPDIPLLRPSPLPPPLDEPWTSLELLGADGEVSEAPFAAPVPEFGSEWACLQAGGALTLPPRSRRRYWLRSEDYVCAYPTLRGVGGRGASVRLAWAESLRSSSDEPVRQPSFIGALLRGVWDEVVPGEEGTAWEWTPTWWRCGRFLRLDIETGEHPVRLDALELRETRYPFEPRDGWFPSDPALRNLFGKCVRSLQVCAHETFMDCPYFEQLQYLGDTRIQMLCSYAVLGDDRLARLALWTYAVAARNPSGWMPSSAPSNGGQRIGTFALWWVEMLHDFLVWRGDVDFIRPLLPTARTILETWLEQRRGQGLIELPPGWNYLDAAGALGNLPGPHHGAIQWHVAGVLRQLSELEKAVGEPELSARAARLAREVASAGNAFWNEPRGLMADDLKGRHFSEQTNVLALRSGLLEPERCERIATSLFDHDTPDLTHATVYFMHYAFEMAKAYGRTAWMDARLAPWRALEAEGLATTPESWGRTRSECHAWGAHPLLHFTVSGAVRPTP